MACFAAAAQVRGVVQSAHGAGGSPASLQQLTFEHFYDKPVDSAGWPASLQQLTSGHSLNQPIVVALWRLCGPPRYTWIKIVKAFTKQRPPFALLK